MSDMIQHDDQVYVDHMPSSLPVNTPAVPNTLDYQDQLLMAYPQHLDEATYTGGSEYCHYPPLTSPGSTCTSATTSPGFPSTPPSHLSSYQDPLSAEDCSYFMSTTTGPQAAATINSSTGLTYDYTFNDKLHSQQSNMLTQSYYDSTLANVPPPSSAPPTVTTFQQAQQQQESQDMVSSSSNESLQPPISIKTTKKVAAKRKKSAVVAAAAASPGNRKGSASGAPPGPIPASTPELERRDADGVEWIAFVYSKERVKTRYSIRCDVEKVNHETLSAEFKNNNCIYPRACVPPEHYTGNRQKYETECNVLGWCLAELNPQLRGQRGLIQRAVDSWRNTNADVSVRSRRVRRMSKKNSNASLNSPPSSASNSMVQKRSQSVCENRGSKNMSRSCSQPNLAFAQYPPQQLQTPMPSYPASPYNEYYSMPVQQQQQSQQQQQFQFTNPFAPGHVVDNSMAPPPPQMGINQGPLSPRNSVPTLPPRRGSMMP